VGCFESRSCTATELQLVYNGTGKNRGGGTNQPTDPWKAGALAPTPLRQDADARVHVVGEVVLSTIVLGGAGFKHCMHNGACTTVQRAGPAPAPPPTPAAPTPTPIPIPTPTPTPNPARMSQPQTFSATFSGSNTSRAAAFFSLICGGRLVAGVRAMCRLRYRSHVQCRHPPLQPPPPHNPPPNPPTLRTASITIDS